MTAPATFSKIDQLRSRDGGKCWLCNRPMNFGAEPNSETAPTLEHLIAQSRNGPNSLDNLVLCHPRCNRELRDLPLTEKVKMRDERREKDWKAVVRRQILKAFDKPLPPRE